MYSKSEDLLNTLNIKKNTEDYELLFETAEKIIAEQENRSSKARTSKKRIKATDLYKRFVKDQLQRQEDKLMEENPFLPENMFCPMMNGILKKLAYGIYPKKYADEQMLNQLFPNNPLVVQRIKQCPLIKKTNEGYAFKTESLFGHFYAEKSFQDSTSSKLPGHSRKLRNEAILSEVPKIKAIDLNSQKTEPLPLCQHNIFYAIGASVRVMGMAFLSPFPTEKIMYLNDTEIVGNIKDACGAKNLVVIFSDLNSAKEYAKLKSQYDNDTGAAYYQKFSPVLEISLSNEEKIENTSLEVGYSTKSKQKFPAGLVNINDVKAIHSCWYCVGAHRKEKEITLQVRNLSPKKIPKNDKPVPLLLAAAFITPLVGWSYLFCKLFQTIDRRMSEGQSEDYWRAKYNFHNCQWTDEADRRSDLPMSSSVFWMLVKYCGADYAGLWGVTGGGSLNRFWSGRMGTNHGDEVTQTLKEYKSLSHEQQSLAKLLSILKEKLKDKTLSPDGDLRRILQVTEEKTGLSLENCDAALTSSSKCIR
jgi:hypothetical protein